MNFLNFIIWSPEPEIVPGIDWIPVRWYGLLFAMGFIIGQQIMFHIYKKEGKPQKDVESLTIFIIIATILGARLGHVLFYEPEKYLQDPISIFKTWEGGLASHGAAVGIIIGVYLFSNYFINISFSNFAWKRKKRPGQRFLYVFDRLVIVVALGGAFIRFGNFLNSEIIGKPTNTDSGVVFAHDVEQRLMWEKGVDEVVITHRSGDALEKEGEIYQPVNIEVKFTKVLDQEVHVQRIVAGTLIPIIQNYKYISEHIYQPVDIGAETIITKERGQYTAVIPSYAIPRHPAQLYESISSFVLFILLFLLWNRYKEKTPEGLIFGIFLIVLFSFRFGYEFFKENQVAFEDSMTYNMGQLLSIPLILMGVFILLRIPFVNKKTSAEQ